MKQVIVSIHEAHPTDQKSWNTHVDHPLQTWEWGEFRKTTGVDVTRLISGQPDKPTACWQLTFHPIQYTAFTVGYFPKGPLPTENLLENLLRVGTQKNAIFIQLEPNVVTHPEPTPLRPPLTDFVGQATHNSQLLKPSHRPLFTKYTFVIDLTNSLEDLLKQMHHKTRYNIRLAQKYGVSVIEDNSDEAFTQYLSLLQETTKRDKFYAHTPLYHQKMWENMKKSGMAKLFLAQYQEKTLAAWIVFVFKDTLYYPYGASARIHKEIMAPNYLLWEIIKWGKHHGFKKFDLWGALGPNPDPHDPFYGFHRFKQGYNPTLVEFIGSYDLVIKPALYALYAYADSLRWFFLRNMKRIY